MIALDELQDAVGGAVRIGHSLGPCSALGVGGPADYYVEPRSRAELLGALRYLTARGVPVILVRQGANFLVSDEGFRGAALNVETALGGIETDGRNVRVEAGVSLARLAEFAVGRSLGGVETLAGERGTVGGAVVRGLPALLAHAQTVEVFDGARERTQAASEPLRSSADGFPLVLAVTLGLDPAPAEVLMRSRREHLVRLNDAQPINTPRGSVAFRDPQGASAARLIEEAGMKGSWRGGAMLSERSANIVVNTGRATAEDVVALLRSVQGAVGRKLHRRLELEMRLVGFRNDLSAA